MYENIYDTYVEKTILSYFVCFFRVNLCMARPILTVLSLAKADDTRSDLGYFFRLTSLPCCRKFYIFVCIYVNLPLQLQNTNYFYYFLWTCLSRVTWKRLLLALRPPIVHNIFLLYSKVYSILNPQRDVPPAGTAWPCSTCAVCVGCSATTTRAAPAGSGTSPTTTRPSPPTSSIYAASPPSSKRGHSQ